MKIHIQYDPSATELAKASSLFIEKRPLFLITVGFFNVISSFIFIVMILKLFLMGLLPNEWLAFFIATIWLFARRPFNEWLLYKRMKSSPVVGKTLTVELSLNGIVWSGTGLRPGNLPWDHIKYVLEAKNGFVLPNNFTQFLWLPFRGFASTEDIDAFRALLLEKGIVHRVYQKWQC